MSCTIPPCIGIRQTVLNLGYTLQLARVWASSRKTQEKPRTNQPQLTPAHPSSGLRTKLEISCAQIRRRQPGLFQRVKMREVELVAGILGVLGQKPELDGVPSWYFWGVVLGWICPGIRKLFVRKWRCRVAHMSSLVIVRCGTLGKGLSWLDNSGEKRVVVQGKGQSRLL